MIDPSQIRAVLFDLDGTLRHNHPSADHTFFDFAVQLGLSDSLELRRSAMRWAHWYWAQSSDLLADLVSFEGLQETFWVNYHRRHLISFGCSDGRASDLADEIHQLMTDGWKPEDRLMPGVLETLLALRCAGYALGVVSNRSSSFTEHLTTLGLSGYFDCVIAAGEVDAWKPDPAIFTPALEMMGVEPKETIYVGDNYYADVIGAQRAGLRPVLIDPEEIFPDSVCEPPCSVIRQISDLIPLLVVSETDQKAQ